MTEYFDIYDAHQVPIGVKERSAVHRDGDWHKVFHCWVIYRDTHGMDNVIMQKRAPNKDTFPNLLDISAAGHYQAGETIQDGVREVQEELGIQVTFDELIPVGQHMGVTLAEGLIDRQFCDVFLLVHNQDIHSYAYQKDEIAGLVKFSIDDGLNLFSGAAATIVAEAVGFDKDRLTISETDFVPRNDDYVIRVLRLAKRCLNGEINLKL